MLGIDFVEVGEWTTVEDELSCQLLSDDERVARALMREPNALYAFLQGEDVLHTARQTEAFTNDFKVIVVLESAKAQTSGVKKIRELIARGLSVRILGFVPVTHLRYGDFEINLAAGLEDSLIRAIYPPWNGGDRGGAIYRTEEREPNAFELRPPLDAHVALTATSFQASFH